MKDEKLNKKDYFYDLPKELIAQSPLEKRDESKLLVFHKNNTVIEHKKFYNIVDYLKNGDVLVINTTKVLPVRLMGNKENLNGAKVEVFLLKRIDKDDWEALVKPGKRLKPGTTVVFKDKLKCKILESTDFGGRIVRFEYEGIFEEILNEVGMMPLPHYIHKELQNKERYNTVYAHKEGSSAAPTAGLHFTPNILSQLKEKGVIICNVILNVGIGTFRPVKEDNILEHKMHSEEYEIPLETERIVNQAKAEGRRIIAVGTTSMRSLEASAKLNGGKIKAEHASTDIFIYGNYNFKVVDCLITNFHLPESTLIMLVSSFIGYENCMNIYKEAINEKYRFYSFGDSSFLIGKE